MSSFVGDSKIEVTVVSPQNELQKFSVDRTDTLFVFSEKYQNCKFVINGNILVPAFSFMFQGVEDGSIIFAVPEHQRPEKSELPHIKDKKSDTVLHMLKEKFDRKWAQKFSDPESVFERLQNNYDPRTANEAARLADLNKMRIEESSMKNFRRIQERLANLSHSLPERKIRMTTKIPKKPDEPSSDMLPETWINSSLASYRYRVSTSVSRTLF